MIFGLKNRLQVDLGDLEDEKEHLTSFLHSNLRNVEFALVQNKLIVESGRVSAEELQRVVNKFVYRRNLNGTHYTSLQGSTIKIERFKGKEKPKHKKEKKQGQHETLSQSWGL